MSTRIVLFRGINVGGRNSLSMAVLKDILAGEGCSNVCTYIQSGNAVLRSRKQPGRLAAAIEAAVEKRAGFRTRVLVLDLAEFRAVISANPWPAAEPSQLHAWFLAAPAAKADLGTLEALRAESESFLLTGAAFYLHAPAGIGRSKLAARLEKLLGVDATARNWRTVTKLRELALALEK